MPNSLHEAGKIGIFGGKRVFVERNLSQKIVEEKYLLLLIDDGSKSVIETADRDKLPALSDIGVRQHFRERCLAHAGRTGNDDDMPRLQPIPCGPKTGILGINANLGSNLVFGDGGIGMGSGAADHFENGCARKPEFYVGLCD